MTEIHRARVRAPVVGEEAAVPPPPAPTHGLRRAVRNLVGRPVVGARDAGVRLLERRERIQTAGVIDCADLGLAGEDRIGYSPSRWWSLRRILPRRQVSADDVFIDFGSGMGRVIVEAATRYPFRAVIGVELSESLNAIARENVDRNRHRLTTVTVQLMTADVLDYEIPDDVTVAYFFNPFRGQLFATVIERLIASADRRPRKLRVILRNPIEEPALTATGRFRRVRTVRGMRPTRAWSMLNSIRMYDLVPAARGALSARGPGVVASARRWGWIVGRGGRGRPRARTPR